MIRGDARSLLGLVVTFAIRQREMALRRQHNGMLGTLVVPDHGWVRGAE